MQRLFFEFRRRNEAEMNIHMEEKNETECAQNNTCQLKYTQMFK